MKTKSENKKFRVEKELKFRVPSEMLRRIKKATDGYGKSRKLADAAGIRQEYLPNLMKSKLATKTMLDKVLAGISKLEKKAA